MSPPLACIPVCMTFVAIGLIGVVVVVFGLSNPVPIDESPPAPDEPSRYGRTGPPPWWVLALMVLALGASLVVVAWLFPD